MRFHGVLEDLFGESARVAVLRVLLRFPGKSFSSTALAKEAKKSTPQTIKILKKFQEIGVVKGTRVGKSDVWIFNQEHFLVKYLYPLEHAHLELQDFLAREFYEILPENKVSRLFLFGSVATGGEKVKSDIDVLVIVKNEGDKNEIKDIILGSSVKWVEKFGGNTIVPLVYSEKEFKEKRKSEFVREIEEKGIELELRK